MKICIVVSDYYKDISKNLLTGSINELKKHGVKNIKIKFVSGSFEIPAMISKNINKFNGFIALGCIIKGETDHYKFISQAVTNGIMGLSIQFKNLLDLAYPCSNLNQAKIRASILKKNKGKSCFRRFINLKNR